MLKVGLVGIGFMGRGHLDQYIRLMKEGAPVKLVAICDVDANKFNNIFVPGNIDVGTGTYDFSQYHCYTDFDEMIANEDLDFVDMPLPTYLHSHYAIKALNAGLHVFCEKPMARTPEQCRLMIEAANKAGKKLMIGQCLRFWPAYETLKDYVVSGEFGKPVYAQFYRGSNTPAWSYQGWMRDEIRSGGCLLDQHVHDVDMINHVFGIPEAVSTMGCNNLPGTGFDAVSTHYRFPGGFVCTALDDWSQNGDGVQFNMNYRVNFEKGTIIFDGSKCTVHPVGGTQFVADNKNGDDGYYREICYFIDCIINDTPIEVASPESTMNSIKIATIERESALRNGEWLPVTL